jgi:hypothetical protein
MFEPETLYMALVGSVTVICGFTFKETLSVIRLVISAAFTPVVNKVRVAKRANFFMVGPV